MVSIGKIAFSGARRFIGSPSHVCSHCRVFCPVQAFLLSFCENNVWTHPENPADITNCLQRVIPLTIQDAQQLRLFDPHLIGNLGLGQIPVSFSFATASTKAPLTRLLNRPVTLSFALIFKPKDIGQFSILGNGAFSQNPSVSKSTKRNVGFSRASPLPIIDRRFRNECSGKPHFQQYCSGPTDCDSE